MQAVVNANAIREYARLHYIEPAKARRESFIRITAGDVHRAVHLSNRVPQVCQALQSKKFLSENGLALEKLEGPPSGLGTRVVFHYRLLDTSEAGVVPTGQWSFATLRGAARGAFAELGGGEAFLRKERERFYEKGCE